MLSRKKLRAISLFLSLTMMASIALPCSADNAVTTGESIHTATETQYITGTDSIYNDFIDYYSDAAHPDAEISVITSETSLVEDEAAEFKFSAAEAGLYACKVTYSYSQKNTVTPRLKVQLNGKVPYYEASQISMAESYKDAVEITKELDVIPDQEAITEPRTTFLFDTLGYYGGLLEFYLNAGENTLTLTIDKGDITIHSLVFVQYDEAPAYKEASKNFKFKEYKGDAVYYEAEAPLVKSNTSIYAINDASSSALSPYDPFVDYFNIIGGTTWENPGQYVEWEFTVPEDGLYTLAVKYRQESNIGMESYRRILIDNKVPYAELEQYAFKYIGTFQNEVLSVGDEPMLFELEAGTTHTLRMEVVIGELAPILPIINNITTTLMAEYRQVIMITGTAPDTLRDYHLEETIPETLETIEEQRLLLNQIIKKMDDITGSASSGTKAMNILSQQLEDFKEDSYNITKNLSGFRTNISSLTTWVLDAKSQPLKMDYFAFANKAAEIKPAQNNFLVNIFNMFKSFLYTFSSKYEHNEVVYNKPDTISIWGGGSSVLFDIKRQMIQEDFCSKNPGIEVSFRLVSENMVEAILSGKGPDLYLGLDDGTVMNFAFRNAIVELSQFEEFEEIKKRYRDSAFESVTYRDKVYGIPENQAFSMIYYRKDIFEELGLEVPETWHDVIYTLSMLQKQNLAFGIPFDAATFYTMIYQYGGTIYNEDQTATALGTDEVMDAFATFTSYFTDYSAPLSFDGLNRFRSGEMPILIGAMAFSVSLDLLAPELDGKWEVAPYPGMTRADGTIDRSVVSGPTVNVIMNENKKDMCWDFIEWYTQKDVIVTLNSRNEQALGASVRDTPAIVDALYEIPWDEKVLDVVRTYEENGVHNIPSVPGSYMLARHVNNAIRAVVYNDAIPGDALKEYINVIDNEITHKRKYFGLTD